SVRLRVIVVEFINDDQIEIRVRGHLAPAEPSESYNRPFLARNFAVQLGKIACHPPVKRTDENIRKSRIGFSGLCSRNRSRQDAGADQERLFVRKRADAFEKIFVAGSLSQRAIDSRT